MLLSIACLALRPSTKKRHLHRHDAISVLGLPGAVFAVPFVMAALGAERVTLGLIVVVRINLLGD